MSPYSLLLFGGRIFTGQRGFIPGVAYNDDFWLKRCRDAKAQFDADKTKLHTYSAWDEVPGSPATRIRWGEWLARYLPLVEEGTWAWLEIGESGLFTAPLPEGVVASALANRGFHLVLANYNRAGMTVTTTDPYRNATDAAPATTWTVFPRSLLILEKA